MQKLIRFEDMSFAWGLSGSLGQMGSPASRSSAPSWRWCPRHPQSSPCSPPRSRCLRCRSCREWVCLHLGNVQFNRWQSLNAGLAPNLEFTKYFCSVAPACREGGVINISQASVVGYVVRGVACVCHLSQKVFGTFDVALAAVPFQQGVVGDDVEPVTRESKQTKRRTCKPTKKAWDWF